MTFAELTQFRERVFLKIVDQCKIHAVTPADQLSQHEAIASLCLVHAACVREQSECACETFDNPIQDTFQSILVACNDVLENKLDSKSAVHAIKTMILPLMDERGAA